MFKQLITRQRKETQTGMSAFFCAFQELRFPLQLAIALVLLVAVSSTHAQFVEGRKPSVHLKGLSFKSVDWATRTAQTELLMVVDNPGPALKLRELSYQLKLNEKQAAEGKSDKEIELPTKASTTLNLPCSIDLSALPGVAWAIVEGGFDVHYQLETQFTVPLFPSFSPRVKSSINGDLSLTETVSGWSARITERIAGK